MTIIACREFREKSGGKKKQFINGKKLGLTIWLIVTTSNFPFTQEYDLFFILYYISQVVRVYICGKERGTDKTIN